MLSRQRAIRFAIVGSIAALTVGGGIATVYYRQDLPYFPSGPVGEQALKPEDYSIQELRTLPPQVLESIATASELSLDRSRARYLLAQAAFETDPTSALRWLQHLDQDYPLLAPHILSLQAQLSERLGDAETAYQTWQALLERYGTSPIAAEALYALGKTDPPLHDRLLAQWPAHPLAMELTLKRLEAQPDDKALLLRVVRHGLYTFKLNDALERLVKHHASALQPEDWESIGFAYWEKVNYPGAASAYAQAPVTPLNLYRAARSFQVSDQTEKAIQFYKQLAETFPEAPETALGLKRLAPLMDQRDRKAALAYWDQLYQQFPQAAAAALKGKAESLEALGSKTSALQARQSVLTQYSDSEAAADMRWQMAQGHAQAGDLEKAARIAQAIPQLNSHSEIAPKAGFWAGRWWQALGQDEAAQQSFETVLRQHPESYYAWRSAVFLNLPVGSFTTVWQQQPLIAATSDWRSPLPAGSELLNELYQLGQDSTAWRLWQVEFTNPMQPTVPEQFTDGLMRIRVGDYLDGIFMLTSLAWREDPDDQGQYLALRQEPSFWNSLYPLPFNDSIQTWSQQRFLNSLLVRALIRQESRFMPGIISSAGATGLMQVMPETGEWVASQMGLTEYQLNNPDDSVNLGTWYLNYTHEEWEGNSLLAVASYNAGPGNVADWLTRFGFEDPDVFVEQIPFAETQGYVEAVFENYWNYLRLYNPEVSQLMAHYSPEHVTIALNQGR